MTTAETKFYQQLKVAVAPWADLTDAQWTQLAAIFRHRTAAKKDYLLVPGDMVHELVFVCHGLLRFYYLSADGTESNKAFIAENTFAGPLGAFTLNLPVMYGVQALEDTSLLVATYTDFAGLFDEHPAFDRLGRRLAEWLLARKELRARSLLQQQASERYLDFVSQHRGLVQRVPQYHIASYLGITEVSLSRLRRALAQSAHDKAA
ncbi:MAG: Crp/Fnr family transcriptional regulator [Okeania sp. SIO3B3]|nr:Crp/Fnr family transcriptional regulator [Okeania sp. SIO3B3]